MMLKKTIKKAYLIAPLIISFVLYIPLTLIGYLTIKYYAGQSFEGKLIELSKIGDGDLAQIASGFASIVLTAFFLPYVLHKLIHVGNIKLQSIDNLEIEFKKLCEIGIEFIERDKLTEVSRPFLCQFRLVNDQLSLIEDFDSKYTFHNLDTQLLKRKFFDIKKIVTGYDSRNPVMPYFLVSQISCIYVEVLKELIISKTQNGD